MGSNGSERRLRRWENATAYPLTALSVLFMGVYAWPILNPAMHPAWRHACEIADVAIWAVFFVEYLIRLRLAVRKTWFVRSHWFDLAVLILPVLRPLRALRLLNALRVINQHAVEWTRGRLAVYVIAATTLIVLVAGLAVLEAERGHPASNIQSYPAALWWAVCTMTTVGYGDLYPETLEGRLVAVALMIGGLGLIGFITGSLASWIVERVSDTERLARAATRADIAILLREVRKLQAEVADLKSRTVAKDPDPHG
ncbi:potassium channel family protein [Actinoplanes sp. KI2]|uniref:potassium channel family protein n=1 Tax=Actinoplanes sp. KI2 TaxID=2983315 RepID=UPI0021D59787|nr:potassium channel family protein [Actinoplanes sp. KI2]MCU7722291.1 potassium channel family protein [Actinoplanes sp. KI2]